MWNETWKELYRPRIKNFSLEPEISTRDEGVCLYKDKALIFRK